MARANFVNSFKVNCQRTIKNAYKSYRNVISLPSDSLLNNKIPVEMYLERNIRNQTDALRPAKRKPRTNRLITSLQLKVEEIF